MGSISFIATGDSFITRRLANQGVKYTILAELIQSADVRFTNLEVTTHRYEGFPGAVSGGTWAIAPPEVLADLKAYGFNLVAWANNHSLDYSYGGLEATAKYLDAYGFVHAGCGENLARAGEPKYLDTPSGRVALIAVTSSFHESWPAGEQRADMIGRPGVNPLRHEIRQVVTARRLEELRAIAEVTGINAEYHYAVESGYRVALPEGQLPFGSYIFEAGEKEGVATSAHAGDMKRILKAVSEAARQADVVLVSIHTHEMQGAHLDEPADFLREFAHACIDTGAHAVIGHGPHKVCGMEMYKERPIFYSLGNFIFQNETVAHLPADYYTKFGLDSSHGTADAFDQRGQNDTRGMAANLRIWQSFLPRWTMENGRIIEITLHPIEMGFGLPRYQRGWPELSSSDAALQDLQRLSKPMGTNIRIAGGTGKVELL
ncbi:CapA family protein [Paenibacillus odorifer]|uniref:CapA family protein n=1 Tax=Paenibacillus odorifer TaxID=189426 RepID=UPI00096FF19E|nr:CapA family protein [Paenibacillus odorifer]OMD96728.1 capsule biosynthesis protein [Paenibacillus odorifer]